MVLMKESSPIFGNLPIRDSLDQSHSIAEFLKGIAYHIEISSCLGAFGKITIIPPGTPSRGRTWGINSDQTLQNKRRATVPPQSSGWHNLIVKSGSGKGKETPSLSFAVSGVCYDSQNIVRGSTEAGMYIGAASNMLVLPSLVQLRGSQAVSEFPSQRTEFSFIIIPEHEGRFVGKQIFKPKYQRLNAKERMWDDVAKKRKMMTDRGAEKGVI
eukprot:Gb_30777 [translate_table: standard]